MRKPDLLPALGVNPSPVTERFAGLLPTPVAGFGSTHRPGLSYYPYRRAVRGYSLEAIRVFTATPSGVDNGRLTASPIQMDRPR